MTQQPNLVDQLMMMQLWLDMQKAQNQQRQPMGMGAQPAPASGGTAGGVRPPAGSTTLLKNAFKGGESGYGGVGNVAAIIALQHELSNATDSNRRFEGAQTDDIFSSKLGGAHFATEPWAAWSFDKLGINAPTAGEKFDAAVENKDWGKAIGRLPGAASHYLDPSTALSYDLLQDDKFGTWGKVLSKAAFPWRWAMDLFD